MSGSMGYSTSIKLEAISDTTANAHISSVKAEVMAALGGGNVSAGGVYAEAFLGLSGGTVRGGGTFLEALVIDRVFGPYVSDGYPAWTIKPDFANSVIERIRFRTDVLISQTQAEQRRRLRTAPRREIDATYTIWRKARRLFDAIMMGRGLGVVHYPLWWDKRELTSAVSVGATQIDVDTTYSEFYVGCIVMILGSDPFIYELAVVRAIGQNQLFLDNTLGQTWNVGTSVYMTRMMRLSLTNQVQASRRADEAFVVQITHESVTPQNFPAASVEVLDPYSAPLAIRPVEMQDITFEYQRILSTYDNESGIPLARDLALQGFQLIQVDHLAHGRAEYYAFKQLLYFLQGKLQPILMPTFMADLDYLDYATSHAADNFIFVTRCGLTERLGTTTPGRRVFGIYFRDGSYQLYTIAALSVTEDNVEAIAITGTLGRNFSKKDIKRISFVTFARLDQDDIELDHATDTRGVTTCTLIFRSLPSVVRTASTYVMNYYTGTYVKNPDPAVIPVDLSKSWVAPTTTIVYVHDLPIEQGKGGEGDGGSGGQASGGGATGGGGGSSGL